jgi:hypothetical protein
MALPTKSKQAFLFSATDLPVSKNGHLYLWTFTFADVIDVSEGRKRWSAFLRKLRKRKRYLKFHGLRVFELHPGGHGLHIHVLTPCFLQVNVVRGVWRSCGGGRVHVLPIPPNRAGYLGKYLRKQGRPECFKGARMWAAFGGCDHTKVKDIRVESNWTRAYALLKSTVRTLCGKTFQSLRWFERLRAVENVLEGLPWYTFLNYAPAHDSPAEIDVIGGNLGGVRVW